MQDRIAEFAQIVENSAADTEGKIANSLEEIADIKEQLTVVGESLRASNLLADEKFSEVLCRVESGISNIVSSFESSNSTLAQGFNEAFRENLVNIEEKFAGLITILDNFKDISNGDDQLQPIEQKIEVLRDEIRLVNTDIADAFHCKSEEILRAFEGIKSEIVQLSTLDFEKTISELKSHFELMFVDLAERISHDDNSELYGKIEQIYKEMFNKVSNIEDYVT